MSYRRGLARSGVALPRPSGVDWSKAGRYGPDPRSWVKGTFRWLLLLCDLDVESQLRYIVRMKSATLPSIRVEPEFRASVEAVLHASESLSEFVEDAVREAAARRRYQAEFVQRGLQSLEAARQTGQYVDADDVVDALIGADRAARLAEE